MNRLIICTILLLASHGVLAEKLYRWVEPDGSITFSPKPPTNGVDYKAVEAIGSNVAQPTGIEKAEPSILATSEHDVEQPAIRVNETKITTRPATAVARQGLAYAPDTGSGLSRSTSDATAAESQSQSTQAGLTTVTSAKKRQQCEDLSKRVLSLEQRLRSKLGPDDMDNTVIAMARYQRSYDQYCIN